MEPRRLQLRSRAVGIEHIVFGTDYFIRGSRFIERTIEFLDSMGLSGAERERIYYRNAQCILGQSLI